MRFYDETEAEDILSAFDSVCEALDIHPERFPDFFPVLRKLLEDKLSYKYKEMWKILDKKSRQSCYSGNKQASALRIDKCEARRADFDRAVFLSKELEMTAPADRLEAAKASVEKARDRYEVLVEELGQELPLLYGARRQFFADNLLGFFGLQKTFHTQVSYIFGDMSEYVLIKLKHD